MTKITVTQEELDEVIAVRDAEGIFRLPINADLSLRRADNSFGTAYVTTDPDVELSAVNVKYLQTMMSNITFAAYDADTEYSLGNIVYVLVGSVAHYYIYINNTPATGMNPETPANNTHWDAMGVDEIIAVQNGDGSLVEIHLARADSVLTNPNAGMAVEIQNNNVGHSDLLSWEASSGVLILNVDGLVDALANTSGGIGWTDWVFDVDAPGDNNVPQPGTVIEVGELWRNESNIFRALQQMTAPALAGNLQQIEPRTGSANWEEYLHGSLNDFVVHQGYSHGFTDVTDSNAVKFGYVSEIDAQREVVSISPDTGDGNNQIPGTSEWIIAAGTVTLVPDTYYVVDWSLGTAVLKHIDSESTNTLLLVDYQEQPNGRLPLAGELSRFARLDNLQLQTLSITNETAIEAVVQHNHEQDARIAALENQDFTTTISSFTADATLTSLFTSGTIVNKGNFNDNLYQAWTVTREGHELIGYLQLTDTERDSFRSEFSLTEGSSSNIYIPANPDAPHTVGIKAFAAADYNDLSADTQVILAQISSMRFGGNFGSETQFEIRWEILNYSDAIDTGLGTVDSGEIYGAAGDLRYAFEANTLYTTPAWEFREATVNRTEVVSGGDSTIFSATAPSSPTDNQRWVNTTTGKQYVWVVGTNANYWRQLSGVGQAAAGVTALTGNNDLGNTFFMQSSATDLTFSFGGTAIARLSSTGQWTTLNEQTDNDGTAL